MKAACDEMAKKMPKTLHDRCIVYNLNSYLVAQINEIQNF